MIKRLLGWGFIGLLVIGAVVGQNSAGKAYPDCDNGIARRALIKLYDNQRLLPAIEVSGERLVEDRLKGRLCAAVVTWINGSKTEVSYEFYHSGKSNQFLLMWIDYNGGMTVPSSF